MATAPTLPGNFPDAQGITYTGVKKDGPATVATGYLPDDDRACARRVRDSRHERTRLLGHEGRAGRSGRRGELHRSRQQRAGQTAPDVQGPDRGHDHHPPRLRIALAAGAAGLALAAPAAAAQDVPLPSPLAPLSPSPPLGPATSSRGERAAPNPLDHPCARLGPAERSRRSRSRPTRRSSSPSGRLLPDDRCAAPRRRSAARLGRDARACAAPRSSGRASTRVAAS